MLLLGALFALLMLWGAAQPGTATYVTVFGRNFPVPWGQARIGWTVIGLGLLAAVVQSFIVAAEATFSVPSRRRSRIRLAPDEEIRWSGRLGMRSFGKERLIVAALMILGALPLAAALIWVSSWPGENLGSRLERLIFGGMFLLAVGPLAFVGPWTALFRNVRWLCELTGGFCVTDRRLLWRGPRGAIRSELPVDRLLSAELVEVNGGRGWISLLVRKGSSSSESIELRGIPDAENAVAAIRRSMTEA